MKFLSRLLIVVLLVGNLVYMAALSVHVVKTPDRTVLVRKSQMSLWDTYVDTTKWSPADLREHLAVVTDIRREGREDLLGHVGSPSANSSPTTVTPTPPDNKATTPAAPQSESSSSSKNIFDFTK